MTIFTMRLNKAIRSLLIGLVLSIAFVSSSSAAQEDLYSWTWWSNISGITSGTINDIIYTYLGILGYTGTLNDRLFNWLVVETGLPSTYYLNDLEYAYFVLGIRGGQPLTFI